MTRKYNGQLEIDEGRGVVYFHVMNGKTLLRISRLPAPIPMNRILSTGGMLDITHMYGASWEGINRDEVNTSVRRNLKKTAPPGRRCKEEDSYGRRCVWQPGHSGVHRFGRKTSL